MRAVLGHSDHLARARHPRGSPPRARRDRPSRSRLRRGVGSAARGTPTSQPFSASAASRVSTPSSCDQQRARMQPPVEPPHTRASRRRARAAATTSGYCSSASGASANGRTLSQPSHAVGRRAPAPMTTMSSGRASPPTRAGRRRFAVRLPLRAPPAAGAAGLRGPLHEAGDGVGQLARRGPARTRCDRAARRSALLALRGDRVVETDALDEATVATIARVGDDDVEEGALLGAAAGKSDDDHVWVPVGCGEKTMIIRRKRLPQFAARRPRGRRPQPGPAARAPCPVSAGRGANPSFRASSSASRPWRPFSSSSASARTGSGAG